MGIATRLPARARPESGRRFSTCGESGPRVVHVQVENLHPRQGNEPNVCRKWPQVFNLRFPRPPAHLIDLAMIATSRAAMISGSASRFRERQCSVQVLPGRCAVFDGEPVLPAVTPRISGSADPGPATRGSRSRRPGGRKNVTQSPDRRRPNREDESANRTRDLAGAGGATTIITNTVGDSRAGDLCFRTSASRLRRRS